MLGAPGDGYAAAPARLRTVAVVAYPERCVLCEDCVDTCPREALSLRETVHVDADSCSGCGACLNQCPYGVLDLREA